MSNLPSTHLLSTQLPSRPTWIEIDAAALANNVRQVRARLRPGCLLTGVVKANAYGHGAVATAKHMAAAGIDRFAVATLDEALELRQGGIMQPILVLGYTPGWLATEAIRHQITLAVVDLATAQAFADAAAAMGQRAVVHLKVNTGMNRLGVLPVEVAPMLQAMNALLGLEVEGIFTHFATADTDIEFAREQLARFSDLLTTLRQQGLRPPLAHAANSPGMLALPESHLDMVRCGIVLYGLDPDVEGAPLPPGFQPVLSWKAQVAQVRCLEPGDAVSYGREFVANCAMTVATLPVGYADGFPRRPHTWGHVLIHGQPAPLLGRVCMDQCIVDVSAIAAQRPVRQGDEVVIIGRQGDAAISAAEAAQRIGTINYDVVSRILARVPRLVINS